MAGKGSQFKVDEMIRRGVLAMNDICRAAQSRSANGTNPPT